MSRKRLVREYTPDFAAGNYKPGDAKMGRHGGKSVQNNSLGSTGYSGHGELENKGEPWPRKHNETAAMCDVDENGVENKPQGVHVSSVGKPTDGHTKAMGHDWPKKPKNRGGSTTTMKGTRYADGGVLGSSNSGVSEGWTPNKIGNLMEGGVNLQKLFDQYAKNRKWVSLPSFNQFCEASGAQVQLDENIIYGLMQKNRDFTFYEGADASGTYWTPITENYEGEDDDYNDFGFDDEDEYDDEFGDQDDMGIGMSGGVDQARMEEIAAELGVDVDALMDLVNLPPDDHGYDDLDQELDNHDWNRKHSKSYRDEDDEVRRDIKNMGDDDDFGGFGMGSGDDEYGEEPMDESMGESWGEGMGESWAEESEDECEECQCCPCECMSAETKITRGRPIRESRRPRRRN